jgi:hypothetical protein
MAQYQKGFLFVTIAIIRYAFVQNIYSLGQPQTIWPTCQLKADMWRAECQERLITRLSCEKIR